MKKTIIADRQALVREVGGRLCGKTHRAREDLRRRIEAGEVQVASVATVERRPFPTLSPSGNRYIRKLYLDAIDPDVKRARERLEREMAELWKRETS